MLEDLLKIRLLFSISKLAEKDQKLSFLDFFCILESSIWTEDEKLTQICVY